MDFQIGDWVYASDWCYGQIMDIDGDSALVEFETERGGGSFWFYIDALELAEEA